MISLLGIALFIIAAYGDVKTFRIPNVLVAAVALLGVTRLFVIGDPSAAVYTVAASIPLLVIGFVLFTLGCVGAGDVKLITATALLMISFAVLVIHRYLPLYAGPRLTVLLPKARLAVPYGVAIGTAGSVTLLFQISLATSLIR